jgi:UDP-N-acetylmuramoyl-L-alanyl-D-glutamate--2,6-diaminopimelate ligase
LLCDRTQKLGLTLPSIGPGAESNALFVAALCLIVGLPIGEVVQGLSRAVAVGRTSCMASPNGGLVVCDSAFLPEDIQSVLVALRPLATGRLCVLLGSVGGRARERRAPLGAMAEAAADFVYLTADDPDAEDPARICEEMLAGMAEPQRACVIPDRKDAIWRAVREMRPGDVLLVIAKPRAQGQLVGGRYLPFDEEAEIRHAFSKI